MLKKISKFVLPILLLVFLAHGCSRHNAGPYATPLLVGNKTLMVEVAKTKEQLRQGLSGREKFRDSQGMLFDFQNTETRRPGFWMKDMKFNLDIMWIKKNPSTSSTSSGTTSSSGYQIVGITADVPAPLKDNANLPLYFPPEEIDFVLEVNAGWGERYGVSTGDEVRFMD